MSVFEVDVVQTAGTWEFLIDQGVWELEVITGVRGPIYVAGDPIVHGDLTGRNDPDQHSSDAITVGAGTLTEFSASVALLAAANEFTAKQSIDITVPVTPYADAGTTKPTILLHLHAGGGAIVDHYAATIDFGGGLIIKAAGTLTAIIGPDGLPTDEWLILPTGASGTGIMSVTSTDPGELPWLSDMIASVPAVLTVGTPTTSSHAATKGYVDGRTASDVGAIPNSLVDAKGDVLTATADNTPARLAVGSNDQVLTADSSTSTGLKWAAPASSGIPATIVDAKGDIIAATAADTVARVAVGSNDQVLTADSGQTAGLKWATPVAPVPLSTIDAAGDLLIGTANDTIARLAIGTARNVLTSDGTTASWGLPSMPYLFPVASGQWFASPHDGVYDQATTLNRVLYVPIPIPPDVTAVDAVEVNVGVVGAAGAVVRLGVHLPHATTRFPDARLIDAGTLDATVTGGTGARQITFSSTAVTPNTFVYVSVVSQGAICSLKYASTSQWLVNMGVPSSTGLDVLKATSSNGWYESSVTGGFGANASPTYASSTTAQVVVALRKA